MRCVKLLLIVACSRLQLLFGKCILIVEGVLNTMQDAPVLHPTLFVSDYLFVPLVHTLIMLATNTAEG